VGGWIYGEPEKEGERNRMTRASITLASPVMVSVCVGGSCVRVITEIWRQAWGWQLFEGWKAERDRN
jgi:hypothetical protein